MRTPIISVRGGRIVLDPDSIELLGWLELACARKFWVDELYSQVATHD